MLCAYLLICETFALYLSPALSDRSSSQRPLRFSF
jgi:hypothetical protein